MEQSAQQGLKGSSRPQQQSSVRVAWLSRLSWGCLTMGLQGSGAGAFAAEQKFAAIRRMQRDAPARLFALEHREDRRQNDEGGDGCSDEAADDRTPEWSR